MTRRDFLYGLAAAPLSVRGDGLLRPVDPFTRLVKASEYGRWRRLSLGDRVGRVARFFERTPYVGGTLETPGQPERCTVRLDGLDCVTLFETSLAFARLLGRSGKPTFDDLVAAVRETRYRDGREEGYLSRLHYTTDWFATNRDRGLVEVLRLPHSQPLVKTIDFMTRHANLYAMLAPGDMPALAEIESRVSGLGLPYVPKADLRDVEGLLKTGDIVGLVTNREGMDIDHTGLIVRERGQARFLHASSLHKKVWWDRPISQCLASPRLIGAMFARPLG